MRKLISFLFIIIIGITVSAQVLPADLKIVIRPGKMVIDKKEFAKDWKLQTVKAALGEPERSKEGYNKTHTYDNFGILVFESMLNKTPSGNISEIQLFFSDKDSNNVTPKGYYTGSLKVDKFSVSKDLSAEEMFKQLKKYTKTESYIEHDYRMAKDGLYIYFQFSDDENTLRKVSIGIDKSKLGTK